MKHPAIILAAALLLAGCATQPKEQIAAVRAAGVSPALVRKLQHFGILSPADIIELRQHRVNDAIALRQLDRTGVDYVVDKPILRQLRTAGVSEPIVSAVIRAGKNFEEQFQRPSPALWYGAWSSPWGYPYDPYYYSPDWRYYHHRHYGPLDPRCFPHP